MPTVRAQPLRLSRVQGLCALGDPSDQYRRRARRLRHTLRNHPSRLQRSLARLASEIDDTPASVAKVGSVLPTSLQARRFEIMVREAMQKGPMRYSQRLAMLKTAAAMGLGRFEANLVLAIEQNRRFRIDFEVRSRDWSRLFTLAFIALVQALILVGAWWICRVR
ncbi:MAG TPA: hypothetical protein VGP94_04815 [Tepidisphaeraceae bacterium]|jgi:hypothetical protein|nr:hypothetical protein [Tepidisphaeraceae bacterium]